MRILGAGVAFKQRSTQTVVVYDPADGRIVHTHCANVLEGGNAPPATEVEQAALRLAEEAGHDCSTLAFLNLGTRSMDKNYRYRVDAKKRALVKGPAISEVRARGALESVPRKRRG